MKKNLRSLLIEKECDEKMKDKNYTNALFKARVAESTENIKHKILFIFLSNIIKSPRLLKRL